MNRIILFGLTICVAVAGMQLPASAQDKKPNNLVIFGDDIAMNNARADGRGVVGYNTPRA